MSDINLPTHSGRVFPTNRITTVRSATTTAIAADPGTTLLTLPQIEAALNPVIIVATVMAIGAGATAANGLFSLRLFRDGTEISTTDRYIAVAIDNTPAGLSTVLTGHWVDTSPGQAPIYTIIGVSVAGFVVNALNRRATARA